jgi:hypothetical protein
MRALWPIVHRCGHRVDWDLSHKHPNDRAGFARWPSLRDCTGCWWAKRRGQRRPYRSRPRRRTGPKWIVQWENAAGMPALSGSDRAVGWARKIRRQLITAALPQMAVPTGEGSEAALSLVSHARAITTARWWIDHRKVEVGDLAVVVGQATRERRRGSRGRP